MATTLCPLWLQNGIFSDLLLPPPPPPNSEEIDLSTLFHVNAAYILRGKKINNTFNNNPITFFLARENMPCTTQDYTRLYIYVHFLAVDNKTSYFILAQSRCLEALDDKARDSDNLTAEKLDMLCRALNRSMTFLID